MPLAVKRCAYPTVTRGRWRSLLKWVSLVKVIPSCSNLKGYRCVIMIIARQMLTFVFVRAVAGTGTVVRDVRGEAAPPASEITTYKHLHILNYCTYQNYFTNADLSREQSLEPSCVTLAVKRCAYCIVHCYAHAITTHEITTHINFTTHMLTFRAGSRWSRRA